jgi:hypothetical protein
MTHIPTTVKAETEARGLYKRATLATPAVAEPQHVEAIRRIVDLTRQSDLLQAEISKEKAKLMGFIQGHETLVDPSTGKELVTWKNGSDKAKVDYDALLLKLNVPPATVAKFTKTEPGSRVFKILDENL